MYQTAKEWLENYRAIKERIRFLNRRIEKHGAIENDGLEGINYDRVITSVSHSFTSIVEKQIIQSMDELERLEIEREVLKEIIESIDSALDGLKVDERKVIKLYYLSEKRRTWWQVANMVGYSQRHTESFLHKRALKKITMALVDCKPLLEKIMDIEEG